MTCEGLHDAGSTVARRDRRFKIHNTGGVATKGN